MVSFSRPERIRSGRRSPHKPLRKDHGASSPYRRLLRATVWYSGQVRRQAIRPSEKDLNTREAAMSVIDSSQIPSLAVPRPQGRTNLRQALRLMRENALTAHGPDNYNADIIAQRILWRRTFIINEPGAIRHVLLDNAANYTKSEVSRRLLGARARPRSPDQRGRDLAPPSPHHGAGLRSAQRHGLRADHDRGHAGSAGEMGRVAGAARSRCRRGDDARDPAHYFARDVFVRLRRDCRRRRKRRQSISDECAP